MDVEVFNLVACLGGGNHVQEFSQTVLLEVLLCQVFQVSLWESNVGWNGDLAWVAGHGHVISEVSNLVFDFDSGSKELSEVGGVEDLILDWLGAVNGEGVADFLFLGNFFTHGEWKFIYY